MFFVIPNVANSIANKQSAGPFSFKVFHSMRLTASLGSEAKSRNVSVIFVYPLKRPTDIAVFRKAAITCGRLPVLVCEASSRNAVSRTQCTLVLYRPMSTLEFEQIFGRGDFGGEETRNAILRLAAHLTRFCMLFMSFVAINLCKTGPVDVLCQQCACRHPAPL